MLKYAVPVTTTILLLEDDDALANVVTRYFSGCGYAVRRVASISGAREAIDRRKPDLILLDLLLPDGHGFDLLNYLQEIGADIPTVIISSAPEAVILEGVNRHGAHDFGEQAVQP